MQIIFEEAKCTSCRNTILALFTACCDKNSSWAKRCTVMLGYSLYCPVKAEVAKNKSKIKLKKDSM